MTNENEPDDTLLTDEIKFDRAIGQIDVIEHALKRHDKFLNTDPTKVSLDEATLRFERIKSLLDEVLVICKPLAWTMEINERIETFETLFFDTCGKFKTLINQLAPPASPTIESTPLFEKPTRKPMMKTPKLNIPKFDGTTSKWLKFRDLFTSMVHENADIDNITKFMYLEEAMTIPADQSNVLQNFTISASNYESAWKAVRDRYDDKRKILAYHLNGLFATKKMANSSAEELLKLLDTFDSHLSALAQFNYKLESDDDFPNLIFVHLLTTKLDDDILKEWRKESECDTPAWEEVHSFLRGLWRSLDDISPVQKKIAPKTTEVKVGKSSKTFVSNTSNSKSEDRCVVCQKNHGLWLCSQFIGMSSNDRWTTVKSNKLCFICLRKGHGSNECLSKAKLRCKQCTGPHGSLLHFERNSESSKQCSETSSVGERSSSTLNAESKTFTPFPMNKKTTVAEVHANTATTLKSVTTKRGFILLSTIAVLVQDSDGDKQLCRALLDTGSDTNFITAKCAERLNLEFRESFLPAQGIHGQTTIVRHQVNAQIESRYGKYVKELDFSVLSDITGNLPPQSLDVDDLRIPANYFLADPMFYESTDVDMLLNAEVFYDALLNGKLELPNGPRLVETTFGWIVGGEIKRPQSANVLLSCLSRSMTTCVKELDAKIDKFIAADEIVNEKPVTTPEEKFCEELFTNTTKTAYDGKFVVELPLKSNHVELGNNLANARRTAHWQEKERAKNPTYDKLYCDYMEGMIKSGYMTEIEPKSDELSYYLPHHGVLKPTSTSTKLRPVFNASSKSETGLSLNDVLCLGPTVQPESFDTILRFREKKFVITGDITKMYLQVWVDPRFRKYQRILWRADVNSPMKHYELNTVTFGLKCSPYLATRCVKQLALDNALTFPEAAAVLLGAFYVDDMLFCVESIINGIKVRDEVRYLLAKAGMPLCKICSNDPALLEDLPSHVVEMPDETEKEITKTLGIVYHANSDQFSYDLKLADDSEWTRAKVYSQIASIYDPIGWIGPVVLTAKLFMKTLVLMKLGWNEQLPDDIADQWNEFRRTLPAINEIRLNRRCYIDNHVQVELHGFCDASINGYGAMIYALSRDKQGETQVTLICAKSRVAPKNQKTLARLELCAATLLAKLIHRIISIFKVEINDVSLWSDSTIVMNWIAITPASRLQTFVGNRVAVIQELTHEFTWKHVRGIENPADLISRGLPPLEMENCQLWWNGPSFFRLPKSEWPIPIITLNEEDPDVASEMKKSFIVRNPNPMLVYIETRWSSLRTLIRCVAMMKRFIALTHRVPDEDPIIFDAQLSLEEIEAAEKVIVRIIQEAFFPDEQKLLEKQREFDIEEEHDGEQRPEITRKSTLHSLAPFMDEDGIIRVGGRLQRSPDLNRDQKHQIILPDCHFTTILIENFHMKHLHPGQQALVSFVREKYWPLRLKKIIKRVKRRCLVCFRAKPTTPQQLMSELPEARITATHPFTHCALDYAGYYHVRTSLAKKSSKAKAYVVMFKCMCTLSIHLELVTDLSSNAFIAALDRFVSRRGLCRAIYSDNATCFVGADAELKRIARLNRTDVEDRANNLGIEWKFTTPRAPHAGGIYESGIKNMKHHLTRVLGKSLLTFEQFTTVLCKIEAVLNSRPLTPMSDDPNDLQALTPGHFLVGRPLISKPERNYLHIPENRLLRWEALQHSQQSFWKEWQRDYLHTLQARPNRFRDKYQVEINDMVLVHEPNQPPMRWLLGRIVKLFPGRNGIVRNVMVKTQYGEKMRDIRYLSFLPYDEDLPIAAPEGVPDQVETDESENEINF